jgi:hypothetical protein
VEEKGTLLIHLISFTCGRERYNFHTSDLLHQRDTFLFHTWRRSDVSKGYLSLPHVKEIRCIKRIPFSSTREGDQMYQKDTFLWEGYPFDTSDLLHVWKRKVSCWYIWSPSRVEEKGILLIHLISVTCGREGYPFNSSIEIYLLATCYLIHILVVKCEPTFRSRWLWFFLHENRLK